MKQVLMAVAAAAVLAATGYVHGVRTDRWRTDAAVQAAAERLKQVPEQIGDWHSEDNPLGEKELQIGQIKGYVSRTYTNRATGDKVQVLLVSGRPGSIGAHTPEVCYGGAGFQFPHPTSDRTVAGGQFRQTVASKTGPNAQHLQVLYAWGTDGTWHAPRRNPRWVYFREPSLYKLYVVRRLATPQLPEPKDDPTTKFLETLLPRIKSALSPT